MIIDVSDLVGEAARVLQQHLVDALEFVHYLVFRRSLIYKATRLHRTRCIFLFV